VTSSARDISVLWYNSFMKSSYAIDATSRRAVRSAYASKAAAVDYWTSRRAVGFANPPTLGPAVD
jgi:hypothetical protein